MPQSTRHKIIRKLEQAEGNLRTAGDYIAECGAQFHGTHEEHYAYLVQILTNVKRIEDAVISFKEKV